MKRETITKAYISPKRSDPTKKDIAKMNILIQIHRNKEMLNGVVNFIID